MKKQNVYLFNNSCNNIITMVTAHTHACLKRFFSIPTLRTKQHFDSLITHFCQRKLTDKGGFKRNKFQEADEGKTH